MRTLREMMIDCADKHNVTFTKDIENLLNEFGFIQYKRGKNHAICNDCEYFQKNSTYDKRTDDVCGKLEECKSCKHLNKIFDIDSFFVRGVNEL